MGLRYLSVMHSNIYEKICNVGKCCIFMFSTSEIALITTVVSHVAFQTQADFKMKFLLRRPYL